MSAALQNYPYMNTNGMQSASLVGSPLEPLHALRTPGTASPRGESVSEASLPQNQGLSSHIPHSGNNHRQVHRMSQLAHDSEAFQNSGIMPFQESLKVAEKHPEKLAESVHKVEGEIASMNQDMVYFRHVVEFQNQKIDKLTQLLLDLLHNKDVATIVASLQEIQARDAYVDDPGSVGSMSDDTVLPQGVISGEMDRQIHQVAAAAVQAQKPDKKRKRRYKKEDMHLQNRSLQNDGLQNEGLQNEGLQDRSLQSEGHQNRNHNGISDMQNDMNGINGIQNGIQNESLQNRNLENRPMQMESRNMMENGSMDLQNRNLNIPPMLEQQLQNELPPKQNEQLNDKDMMPGLEVVSINEIGGRKRPKVEIDFLHNPMTVKDIYDEFTKGFRGQPPLREMDERFGKHQWRGDSRSKESKRFQRRKKLCNAIERGMEKYGKSQEEIMNYIEEFRGDKSLTWVMNGHLPSDLLE